MSFMIPCRLDIFLLAKLWQKKSKVGKKTIETKVVVVLELLFIISTITCKDKCQKNLTRPPGNVKLEQITILVDTSNPPCVNSFFKFSCFLCCLD